MFGTLTGKLARLRRGWACLFCLLFVLCTPCLSFAQDDFEDAELDKEIAVLEPRPFTKAGRGEIALGLSTIASDLFVVYMPVNLRFAYHVHEWVSVELSASFMGCFSGEVSDDLTRTAPQKCLRFLTPSYDSLKKDAPHTQLRSANIEQYQVARFAFNPIFSPFVGKFRLTGGAIVHYDLNLAAGLGIQLLETLDEKEIGKIHYGVSVEGNLGLGLRFVFLNFVGLRLDFREYLYEKKRDQSLGTASEFGLSLSFLL